MNCGINTMEHRHETIPKTVGGNTRLISLKFLTGKTFHLGYVPFEASTDCVPHLVKKLFGVPKSVLKLGHHGVARIPQYISDSYVFNVALRLRAGKGGFGNMLKAKGKNSTQKTVSFDACRNLLGQRVRHERQVEALQRWAKGEDNADDATLLEVGGVLSISEQKRRQQRHERMLKSYERESKANTARDQQEDRERKVQEVIEDEAASLETSTNSTKDALSSVLGKRKGNNPSLCPNSHPLKPMVVGRVGSSMTGFDFNICDECDAAIEHKLHRCSDCDYDICCECKDKTKAKAVAEAGKLAESVKQNKKKRAKGKFSHGFESSDDDE
eukprot:TRINITY_DN16983_c0_g1_i1.p1 TRINITY_DN16983_c0_g1~~TRINITY_DN16983_c0_g1_i1.p1  ORF type:complete len:328 (+),score=52.86 TRINITY_DN16983_c0_g1_i1:446-1429(+)